MARRSNLRKQPTKRRQHDPAVHLAPPNVIFSTSGVGTPTSTALITFSGNVNVSGATPNMTYSGGTFTLAQVSGGVIRLTGGAGVTPTAKTLTIGQNEPSLRTVGGGFVTPVIITF